MGLLSRTLGLPGQRGVVVILQDDQVWGGVPLVILGFRLSALSKRGSSSDGSPGVCLPQAFSRCCEPELGALLGGWET